MTDAQVAGADSLSVNWYVNTSEGPVGPLLEEHVITMLRSGVPVTVVRPESADRWMPVASHPPFAGAMPPERRLTGPTQRRGAPPSPSAAAPLLPDATKLAKLQVAAYVAIIVGVTVYAADTAIEAASVLAGTPTGKMTVSSYSNADAAHVTITNEQKVTMYTCVRGSIQNKVSQERVRSVVVCTGEMKPHTTVTLQAPYPAGSLRKLCTTKDRLGIDVFDWDPCTFELESAL